MKTIITLLSLTTSLTAFAHCPAHSKAQKVCFMLDDNKVYIYDEKLEHNGPYKDLNSPLIFKDGNGKLLVSKKLTRGIYQIENKDQLKSVLVEGPEKILVKAENKQ